MKLMRLLKDSAALPPPPPCCSDKEALLPDFLIMSLLKTVTDSSMVVEEKGDRLGRRVLNTQILLKKRDFGLLNTQRDFDDGVIVDDMKNTTILEIFFFNLKNDVDVYLLIRIHGDFKEQNDGDLCGFDLARRRRSSERFDLG